MIYLKWRDGRVTKMAVDPSTLPRFITYGTSSGQMFERTDSGDFREVRSKTVGLADVIDTEWPRSLRKFVR